MDGDSRQTLVFGAAAAVRLLLFTAFKRLPDLLTGRVEISTPITSFKRLQEGLFLYSHNVSPYDGGVFHQAPLLLPLFDLLPDIATYPLFTYVLYICVDVLSARALVTIAESGEAGGAKLFASPRKDKRWDGASVAAFFLFNPFTIATCIGRPTSVFTTCAIIQAVAQAVQDRPFTSMLALSLAAYLSMYPILLLPPLILLCFDRRRSSHNQASLASYSLRLISTATTGLSALLLASRGITGSWGFIASTYGVQLLLRDLTPNIGLWWYFFIEMFDSFRAFFLGVFWLHLSAYVGGFCIRLRRQPLAVIVMMLGVFAIFKPCPSVSDTSLFLALLPLYRHIFPLMRYPFLAASAVMYTALLGPAFYYLWIYAGSGNANFFYAITLVWSLAMSILVADVLFAVLRDEWEAERPEMRGKEVRQI